MDRLLSPAEMVTRLAEENETIRALAVKMMDVLNTEPGWGFGHVFEALGCGRTFGVEACRRHLELTSGGWKLKQDFQLLGRRLQK